MCFGSLPSVSEAARARRGGRHAAGARGATGAARYFVFYGSLDSNINVFSQIIAVLAQIIAVFCLKMCLNKCA